MKKLIFGLLAAAVASGFAGQVVKVTFETQGPDCYKSGAVVADGECYALVWVRAGAAFAGFLADGSVVDPVNSRTLLVRPLAVNGHCQTYAYQAAEAFVKGLGAGGYVVCLLDTRGPTGWPLAKFAPDANGVQVPVAVNGYQVIADAAMQSEIVADTTSTMASTKFDAPVRIANAAALPVAESELQPVIKSAEMRDGKFVVTVERTVPYLTYDLTKGEDPLAMGESQAADEAKPGLLEKTETIELETDASGSVGFIRVTADRHQN